MGNTTCNFQKKLKFSTLELFQSFLCYLLVYRASLKARIMFLDNAEVSVANLLSYLKNSFSYCKNFSSSGNKSSERRLFYERRKS